MPELHPIIEQLRGGLIVSCQAERDDAFNRPDYVALFARAAEMGGARGIRARDAENIAAIKLAVSLPLIGITKNEFPDGSVLITGDFSDAEAVIGAGADILAADATQRTHPNGLTGSQFVREIKKTHSIPLMADISTFEEGVAAADAGADILGTTLSGYTPYTSGRRTDEPDWRLVEALVGAVDTPVVVEGGVWTPEQARRAIDMGAYAVVVGTAITRPRVVTMKFVEALK